MVCCRGYGYEVMAADFVVVNKAGLESAGWLVKEVRTDTNTYEGAYILEDYYFLLEKLYEECGMT
jgi:hypothetical protein